MLFDPPLLEGRLVSRYKRFLADVRLPGGEVITVHCPNSGRMTRCFAPEAPCWIQAAGNPARKLGHTLVIVEAFGGRILVDTSRPNALVTEAILAGRIPELAGYTALQREVRYGERSRVDLLLTHADERCYVEVKNATMGMGGGRTLFPDAVTERGERHLRELMQVRAAGHRAVLFFCAGRDDTAFVSPADDVDPTYGRTLRAAARAGVELLAWRCVVDPQRIELAHSVPVVLDGLT